MADRYLQGWRRARDERTGSWALFPCPTSALGPPVVDVWRYRASAPFPQPSAGRPVALRSAGRAPSADTLSAPEAPTAQLPRVIPLGGDLALVSVGRWDEESATTIQLPAVRPGPEPDLSPAGGDRTH